MIARVGKPTPTRTNSIKNGLTKPLEKVKVRKAFFGNFWIVKENKKGKGKKWFGRKLII